MAQHSRPFHRHSPPLGPLGSAPSGFLWIPKNSGEPGGEQLTWAKQCDGHTNGGQFVEEKREPDLLSASEMRHSDKHARFCKSTAAKRPTHGAAVKFTLSLVVNCDTWPTSRATRGSSDPISTISMPLAPPQPSKIAGKSDSRLWSRPASDVHNEQDHASDRSTMKVSKEGGKVDVRTKLRWMDGGRMVEA